MSSASPPIIEQRGAVLSRAAGLSVSIEVPVFKGAFLRPCIDSVLAQTSDAWTLSLVWDGGDAQSRAILEALEREGDPRIRVYFTENRGIAAARKFLTERGEAPWLLPLDDDDMLPRESVARFLDFAADHPWASLIRARRALIDANGALTNEGPTFPFGPRSYFRGMVTDPFNQSQPYLIRRSAYDRTRGWRGFADIMGAGEDCDIFLQLEEVAPFELLNDVLYCYRVHDGSASEAVTPSAGYEMWRRLVDGTLERIGLPLRRTTAEPPFVFEELPRPDVSLDDVDFFVRAKDSGAGASLRRCGVADAAIHDMAGAAVGRPLACFVDDGVEIGSRPALEALVQAMNRKKGADLLAPCAPPHLGGLLMMRREVFVAAGGFDGWVPPSMRGLDLWLHARRRDFRCATIAVGGIACPASCEPGWAAEDLAALRAKWHSHAALLADAWASLGPAAAGQGAS
jgi:glycosyltransferase involved in cell wall biosynthesis